MSTCKILCVCYGNSDRSPVMAAILTEFLKKSADKVICDSAGISESIAIGTSPLTFAITAANRIGLDLTAHRRRHTSTLNLKDYDLLVCASDDVAALVIQQGADLKKVYNAQVANPWPCQFQEDYDTCFSIILSAMYRVVTRYFP